MVKNNNFKLKSVKLQKNILKNTKNKEKTPQKLQIDVKNEIFLNEQEVVEGISFKSESVLEGGENCKKSEKIECNLENRSNSFIKDFDKVENAKIYLENLLKNMNFNAKISILENNSSFLLQIDTQNSEIFTKNKAQFLHAVQTLINSTIKNNKLCKKILIDVDDYHKKQAEKIENQTKQAIEKCLKTAKPVSMDYMNSFERFIVHEIVMQDGRVTSESFGKEPRRFVKIYIK